MLFREIMAVYTKNHIKPMDTLCGQNSELQMLKQNLYRATRGLYSVNTVLKNTTLVTWVTAMI
jgi:hypothetical protein